MTPKITVLNWNPTYRLIPSRFPPVSLFDRVASAEDMDAIFAIQGLTNPRLRQELGKISLVPMADRVYGHGSTPVMAAFTHLNSEGSRFSDGTWGVYYAASTLPTAVAEVSFHRSKFLAATAQPPLEVDMRSYVAHVSKPLHDLRPKKWNGLHDPQNYAPPQEMARELRLQNSWGVVYRSVRAADGECVAIFRPQGVNVPVVQGEHVSLCWDGATISEWYRKSDISHLPR